MDQLHCRSKRGVAFPEEIVAILKLRQHPDALELDCRPLPVCERVAQERRALVFDNLATLWKQGIIPRDPAVFIFDRNNERRVIHRKDRRDPVNKF